MRALGSASTSLSRSTGKLSTRSPRATMQVMRGGVEVSAASEGDSGRASDGDSARASDGDSGRASDGDSARASDEDSARASFLEGSESGREVELPVPALAGPVV